MTKKISIYHFLIAVMLFSLVMPAGAGATPSDPEPNPNPEFGTLTIHKFEQEPGAEQGTGDGSEITTGLPEGTGLGGVVYEVIQTHKYDPINDTWEPVTAGGQTYTLTTEADGTVSETNIPLGRYSIKETDGPDNVNLNEDTFFIDVPMTNKNGTETNYNVHIYPKNETIRGAVKLTKRDGSTEVALPGVKFDLYDEGNNKVNDNPLPPTDLNGQIYVDNLAFGKYYFKEIATIGGYVLGGKTEAFNITKSGTVVEVTAYNYKEPGVVKTVDESAVNRGEEVTYTITVDLPADIADYKSFVVTDTLHENLEFVSAETTTGFTFTQDDQNLTWTGDPAALTPGSATITFKAKVSDEAEANVGINNVATIDYTNKHDTDGDKDSEVIVTPTVGGLEVIKQDGDDNNKKLKGAKFELREMDGTVVAGPETTGPTGVIDFGDVDYGDYQLVETKAPDGYRKLRSPIDVTINADESTLTIEVDNYKSGWELPKTGGMGTTLFTLIGLIFMGAAVYLYMRRRRNAA